MKKAQIKQFLEWIKEGYGSPEEFAKILDQGIEMLFYIEDDVFTKREVQSVVGALRGIIEIFRGNTQAFIIGSTLKGCGGNFFMVKQPTLTF